MDELSLKEIDIKKILIFIAIFFASLWIYSSVKNYFQNYFSRIEKKQEEIMNELKNVKAELNKPIQQNSQSDSTPLSLIQEVGKMKEDISKLKDEVANKDDVLGLLNSVPSLTPLMTPTKTESTGLRFVTISNSKWQTVDVFADKKSSSRIVGQALYNKMYPYTKREDGYYYIELSNNLYGWIHNQFVKEY